HIPVLIGALVKAFEQFQGMWSILSNTSPNDFQIKILEIDTEFRKIYEKAEEDLIELRKEADTPVTEALTNFLANKLELFMGFVNKQEKEFLRLKGD
ncbi:MAG TPA: hypothetical protein VHA52_11815, partial [Candidatus Babeliaceae bacterium]|nr:hypothetical protein [Candidatus Babeliaceae bacterium]